MPKSAMNQLHRGVSELRTQGIPIETKQNSYKLTSPPEALDSHRFSTLCGSARAAAESGRHADAVDLYTEALGLWRGSALGGLESDELSLHSDYWNELRLSAEESCIDAEIACGRHREITPKIQIIRAENPLREHLSSQLMVALYRSERVSEALEVYTGLQETLRDSLGVDPGARTEKIYLSILRQDSEVEFP